MTKYGVGLALLLVVTSGFAAEYQKVVTDKSRFDFGFKQMGVAMEGQIKRFDADVRFDPDKLATASARFEILPSSIDTGLEDANSELQGKLWFNSKQHPKISFVSERVRMLDKQRYEVSGKLSIKGRTRDIKVPFVFKPQGKQALFEGAFDIARLDYGIGEGAWADLSAVANPVQIKFKLLVE